jgi:hypothetical protein
MEDWDPDEDLGCNCGAPWCDWSDTDWEDD